MRNALDGVVMHTLLGVQVVYGLFLLKIGTKCRFIEHQNQYEIGEI
ncbi:hypothetical protein [Myroides odoratus]